jgi:hypothetical protein
VSEAQPHAPVDNWSNIMLTLLFGAGQAVMSVQDQENMVAAAQDSQ